MAYFLKFSFLRNCKIFDTPCVFLTPLLPVTLPVVRRVVAGAFVEGSFKGTRTGFRLELRKFLRPCRKRMELEDSKQMLFNIYFFVYAKASSADNTDNSLLWHTYVTSCTSACSTE